MIPKELRKQVMICLHNTPSAGHLGVHKTLGRISERFYWPRMAIDAVPDQCISDDLPNAVPGYDVEINEAPQIISSPNSAPSDRIVHLLLTGDREAGHFSLLAPFQDSSTSQDSSDSSISNSGGTSSEKVLDSFLTPNSRY